MRPLKLVRSELRTSHPLSSSLILVHFFTSLLYLHHACAVDEGSITHEDHNHRRLLDLSNSFGLRHESDRYEPDFVGADRSIIGRAGDDIQTLANNVPGTLNIDQGADQYWTFPNRTLFGPKSPQTSGLPSPVGPPEIANATAPDEIVLYITLTTCIQPTRSGSNPSGSPDQLKLYYSTSSNNQKPGADNGGTPVVIDEGFGWMNISVKDDVFFGVFAPTSNDFSGGYNYQLTASIDGFFASYFDYPNPSFNDSDTKSALFHTGNLTSDNSSRSDFQQWMSRPPAFTIYVQNQDNPSIYGMQRSVCALENFSKTEYDTGMVLGGNGQPKQQFYVKSLNGSSAYYAIGAIIGNSTASGDNVVGGGGTVWSPVNFPTKSDNNCALLYNLTFCTSVAYAVPANPDNSTTDLAQWYDNYATSYYENFNKSLQQIPCNTTSSAQYSLARTCVDCDAAYRQWLCAVSIPRCEDFSNTAYYLQPRAVNYTFINATLATQFNVDNDPSFSLHNKSRTYMSSSRNPLIDSAIAPGPYKELLPCEDLCYGLVQSCPASLQFACPLEGHGLNYSYGKKEVSPGVFSCNFAGVMNAAAGLRAVGVLTTSMAMGAALILMTL